MKIIYLLGLFLIAILAVGCTNKGVTGNVVLEDKALQNKEIQIKGSDTLLQLVSNMAESYSKKDPFVKISVTGGGSGGGIAALINGEIDIADSSREIKAEEINKAKEKGIDIWGFIIARDMLSIVVNEDNQIEELTMGDISKIYRGEITNWNELGGNDEEITLYGRQSSSGTYIFFMEHVLKGDYSTKMRNMEGNQAIIDSVRQDGSGIGYVGIGYLLDENGNQIDGLKIIKVAKDKDSEYLSPLDQENLPNYPISRPLYQYFAGKPEKGSADYQFLDFELSDEGMDIVKESGFDMILDADKSQNEDLFAKI